MNDMIVKLLRLGFFILLIAPLGLTAQIVTGSWYGKADIILDGYPNTYLAELTLRQKGNQVEGVFGYYFKTQYRSFLVRGKYDASTRLLTIRNIPVTYFNSNLEEVPADCFMTLEASLTVARSKSSLKGYILRDSIYRYTCPDLNVQLTRDPESNVDSILAAAKALDYNWKQNANNTQSAAELVTKSITTKDIAPIRVRELSEATREQLRKELESEVRAELRKELEAEVREQLKKDMAIQFLQDLKKEIEQQLTTSLKTEIEEKVKTEIRKEFEAQIRQELKKEIEQQVRSELRKEFEQQIAVAKQQAGSTAGTQSARQTKAVSVQGTSAADNKTASTAATGVKTAVTGGTPAASTASKTTVPNSTGNTAAQQSAQAASTPSRSLFGKRKTAAPTAVTSSSSVSSTSTVKSGTPSGADPAFTNNSEQVTAPKKSIRSLFSRKQTATVSDSASQTTAGTKAVIKTTSPSVGTTTSDGIERSSSNTGTASTATVNKPSATSATKANVGTPATQLSETTGQKAPIPGAIASRNTASQEKAATTPAGKKGNNTSLTNADSTKAIENQTTKNTVGRGQSLPGIRIFSRDRNKQNRVSSSAASEAETVPASASGGNKSASAQNSVAAAQTGNAADQLRDNPSGKNTTSQAETAKAEASTLTDSRKRGEIAAPANDPNGRNRTSKTTENTTTDAQTDEGGRNRMITGMASSENTRSREVTSNEKTLKAVKAFEERVLYVSQEIEISSDSIRVIFYDNGFVDDDTITVFYNKVPVLEKQRLTEKGMELGIRLDSKSDLHDLSMFAENVGSIPPNTALMVIYDGEERHEIFLSSTMRVNGTVRMKKKKL